jgi:hypothetical protein
VREREREKRERRNGNRTHNLFALTFHAFVVCPSLCSPSNAIKNHWNSKLRRVVSGSLSGVQSPHQEHYTKLHDAYAAAVAEIARSALCPPLAVAATTDAVVEPCVDASAATASTDAPVRKRKVKSASDTDGAQMIPKKRKSVVASQDNATQGTASTTAVLAAGAAVPRKPGRRPRAAVAPFVEPPHPLLVAAQPPPVPAPPGPLLAAMAPPPPPSLSTSMLPPRRVLTFARLRKLAPAHAEADVFVDTTVPGDEDVIDDDDDEEDDINDDNNNSSISSTANNTITIDSSTKKKKKKKKKKQKTDNPPDVFSAGNRSLSAADHIEADGSDIDDAEAGGRLFSNSALLMSERDADEAAPSLSTAAAELMLLSPARFRRIPARSPAKRSPSSKRSPWRAMHDVDFAGAEDFEALFANPASLSQRQMRTISARMRALTPISSPSLLSPSAVKLSVPENVSSHVVRRLLSPRKTPLALAAAADAAAASITAPPLAAPADAPVPLPVPAPTAFAAPNNATTPLRRQHSSSVPSTPRRMVNVSQAPPSAPSTQLLANNKAYLTRLSVTAGSSLAERFGVDLSPMSPKASPRKQPGTRGRELHVRTPTAGGSLVIGGSLGQDLLLVRPRNLATSFHAPTNLFNHK